MWEKISGTSTVVPTTTIRGHCGAWSLDVVEGVLHKLSLDLSGTSTTTGYSTDNVVWCFDPQSSYSLPDVYWESDSSGNIFFNA